MSEAISNLKKQFKWKKQEWEMHFTPELKLREESNIPLWAKFNIQDFKCWTY